MFVLDENESNTFEWPVTVRISRKGSKPVLRKFTAEFEVTDQSEIDDHVEGLVDDDLLNKKLKGWSKFKDAKGVDIEYTPENRDQALNMPAVRAGLLESFFEGASGRKRKN